MRVLLIIGVLAMAVHPTESAMKVNIATKIKTFIAEFIKNGTDLASRIGFHGLNSVETKRRVEILNGRFQERLQQTYGGLEVVGGGLAADYDPKGGYNGDVDGEMYSSLEEDIPDPSACNQEDDVVANISIIDAGTTYEEITSLYVKKNIFVLNDTAFLTYEVSFFYMEDEKPKQPCYFIDACNLTVLYTFNNFRNIYGKDPLETEARITEDSRSGTTQKPKNSGNNDQSETKLKASNGTYEDNVNLNPNGSTSEDTEDVDPQNVTRFSSGTSNETHAPVTTPYSESFIDSSTTSTNEDSSQEKEQENTAHTDKTGQYGTTESITLPTTDDLSTLPTTGDLSTLPTTGDLSTLPTTKDPSTLPTTGDLSTLPTTKDLSTLPTTKDLSTLPTTKDPSTLPTTGDLSTLPTTNDPSTLPTTLPTNFESEGARFIRNRKCPGPAKGRGGNRKIGAHRFGTTPFCLDVKVRGKTCYLENRHVRVVDLKQGTRPKGGATVKFTCSKGYSDGINGAYSPVLDAMYYGTVVNEVFKDWYKINPLSSKPTIYVHYGKRKEAAYFNGRNLVFGDGSDFFYPLVGLDVVAHEIAHGFTNKFSKIIYSGEAGAIDESFSDITGEVAKFFARGSNDWEAGVDIVKYKMAMRYFKDPTKDGNSVKHIRNFDGRIHFGSGIFNYAFYHIVKVQRMNIKKAFHCFINANRLHWGRRTTFEEGACGVVKACKALRFNYGLVKNSFKRVGIKFTRCRV